MKIFTTELLYSDKVYINRALCKYVNGQDLHVHEKKPVSPLV